MLDPLKIYFVTVRCFQRRLLMRPSSGTNDVLGGVLARAAERNGVELFAFVFASNHVHLLVRAPRGNLPRFMQYLLTNISKKVGQLVRWKGRFWERRYSAEPFSTRSLSSAVFVTSSRTARRKGWSGPVKSGQDSARSR
jgi:REP element-mobilizing transposase RayT